MIMLSRRADRLFSFLIMAEMFIVSSVRNWSHISATVNEITNCSRNLETDIIFSVYRTTSLITPLRAVDNEVIMFVASRNKWFNKSNRLTKILRNALVSVYMLVGKSESK